MTSPNQTILGIDIGYGHTKWVGVLPSGESKKGMFRSVAPLVAREMGQSAPGLTSLRTITVGVGDNNYVVGKDAELQTDPNYMRVRLNEYSQTEGYRALMLGTLSLSGLREIDQLVIGLPLSTISLYHTSLTQQYQGEHSVGAVHSNRKAEINVRNVTVTSQPGGAILYAATMHPGLRKSTNLVIDMGYFTMDFLMCQGLKPYYQRSGAIVGGMSGYYDHLGAMVAEKLQSLGLPNSTRVEHSRLEAMLSESAGESYFLPVGSKQVDVTECVAGASSKLKEYIGQMLTTLSSSVYGTINRVVLAGGGAKLLLPVVQKELGDHHGFIFLKDAQFAIAAGYVQIGMAAAKRATTAVQE